MLRKKLHVIEKAVNEGIMINKNKVDLSLPKTRKKRLLPSVLLFFLAPVFGEYLLGNLTLSQIILVPFIAPLYGGGALLIREVTRRSGLGPATMLILGVAYGLIEEGLVDQMLFNRSYFTGQEQISGTYMPALGMDAWLTIIVLAMHAIWSTCIPIILVEALFPEFENKPWLNRKGLFFTAFIFIIGSVYLCYSSYLEKKFFASAPELIGTVVVVIVLITAAFTLCNRTRVLKTGFTPNPWIAGFISLAASSLFMLTDMLYGWITVIVCLLLAFVFFTLIYFWSYRIGWGTMHRLAITGGGILTYSWLGVFMEPETGSKMMIDYIGSAIFVLITITLLVVAIWKVYKYEMKSDM
ncbi:hypothetical protein HMPREF0083_04507 [Aneurinibacillus aneurinilyticus ATCC 12856]|uniref:DUF998 domain-containing protein n=2 Tax=Aneurinibacillus aneurinilyticus TaxID=1391 RepID=U1Y5H9_ANEAE|nr:hypothetical protein HMPREF0083_04507 [Aneurinibacillus aneurinilyticus ATCC 12856]